MENAKDVLDVVVLVPAHAMVHVWDAVEAVQGVLASVLLDVPLHAPVDVLDVEVVVDVDLVVVVVPAVLDVEAAAGATVHVQVDLEDKEVYLNGKLWF